VDSTASGAQSIGIGASATASGENATAVGWGSSATGNASSAYGQAAFASANNASAFGAGAIASGSNSTALGNNAVASASNSIALGANSVANRPNTVSVGSAGAERQIANVAPGVYGTDAVNLNQLRAVERKLSAGVASAMAMAPAQIAPGKETGVAMGLGHYAGSSAVGFSISHLVKETVIVNAAISKGFNSADTTSGNNSTVGFRASVGYSF
jgi:autotransporter adhesin